MMCEEKLPIEEADKTAPGAAKKLLCFGAGSALWVIAGTAYGLIYLEAPNAANTLGDFLAGVFAPAAFAMLFAAVWIQSDELREQRKEFRYNREVMKAQASEARKQAQLIKVQTDMLLQARADEEFNVRLRLLNSFVQSTFRKTEMKRMSHEMTFRTVDISYLSANLPSEPEEFLRRLCSRLTYALSDDPGEKYVKQRKSIREYKIGDLALLNAKLEHLMEMEKRLSAAMVAVLNSVNLPFITSAMKALNDELIRSQEGYEPGPR